MTHEELEHFKRTVEQARGTVDDVAPGLVLGVPSRGPWWDAVEELRQAAERLQSACTAILGKR